MTFKERREAHLRELIAEWGIAYALNTDGSFDYSAIATLTVHEATTRAIGDMLDELLSSLSGDVRRKAQTEAVAAMEQRQ